MAELGTLQPDRLLGTLIMSSSLIAFGIGTTAAGIATTWIARMRNRPVCPSCREPLSGEVCTECGTVWSGSEKTDEKHRKKR